MQNKNSMKALLALGLAVCSGAAVADDPWSGFYAGATLGNRQASAEWKTKSAQLPTPPFNPVALQGDTSETLQDDHTLYSGGFLGYRWHLDANVVVGLEGSLGYAHTRSSISSIPGVAGLANESRIEMNTDWDASLVGHLGYLLSPDALVYGLAGVSAERVKLSASCLGDNVLCARDYSQSNAKQEVRLGWTAGVGLEYSLAERITGRLEYRYAQYESLDFQALEPVNGASYGVKGTAANTTSQTLSLGLSYHF